MASNCDSITSQDTNEAQQRNENDIKENLEYLVCKECDACFTNNIDLLVHFKTHRLKLEQVCIFCGRNLEDDGDLINHMLTHGDTLREYFNIFLNETNTLKELIFNSDSKHGTSNYSPEIKVEFQMLDVKDAQVALHNDQFDVKFELECNASVTNYDSETSIKREDDHVKTNYFVDTNFFDTLHTDKIEACEIRNELKRKKQKKKRKIAEDKQKILKKTKRILKNRFKCDHCSFDTSKIETLRQHLKIQCEQKIYSCRKCDFSSKLQYELRMHAIVHSPGELLECSECNFKTKNPLHLKRHHKLHQKKSYFCHICNKTFSRKDHIRAHSEERLFRCSECPVTYKDAKWLKRHLFLTHGIKNKRKQKYLRITNHDLSEGQFKCDECEYSTDDTISLSAHKLKHEGGWPFVCHQCNYKTKIFNLLKGHMIIHKEKCIFCEFCGKTFRRIYNLREHLRTHSDERNFRCTKCPKSYKDNKSLKSHLLHAHKDDQIKSFQCDHCDFRAATLFTLKLHKRRHNPENAYRCKQCTYSCRTVDTLKKHSLIHLNYPVSSCPHCDFKSVFEAAIKRHMRVHKQDSISHPP